MALQWAHCWTSWLDFWNEVYHKISETQNPEQNISFSHKQTLFTISMLNRRVFWCKFHAQQNRGKKTDENQQKKPDYQTKAEDKTKTQKREQNNRITFSYCVSIVDNLICVQHQQQPKPTANLVCVEQLSCCFQCHIDVHCVSRADSLPLFQTFFFWGFNWISENKTNKTKVSSYSMCCSIWYKKEQHKRLKQVMIVSSYSQVFPHTQNIPHKDNNYQENVP